MPEITPTGRNQPADWRAAYDPFSELRQLGASVGEPVSQWRLEIPGRAARILDRRWRMTYTWSGTVYTDVFLGVNGRQSAAAIRQIIPQYRDMVARKLAGKNKAKAEIKSKVHPKYDPGMVRIMKQRHETMTRTNFQAMTPEEHQQWKKLNADMLWFMRLKAGVLDMNMQAYLFRHPHSQIWPTPPATEAELKQRNEEFKARVARREKAIKEMKEDGTWYSGYVLPL